MSQAGQAGTKSGGGAGPIESIGVQAFTAPGTNPVLPDGAEKITVNGTVVAAHSIPIRSDSLAASTFNIEMQYASAVASTDSTKVGLAAFNSANFSVDANGFVSSVATVDYHASPFIVSPSGAAAGAQYTTIASAYAAASTDSVIILQPGTYTENLVLTKRVHFTVLYDERSGTAGAVKWIGKISDGGAAITCSFYGIDLQTNGDYIIQLTGGSSIDISSCTYEGTNHTPFNLANGSANLYLYNTDGDHQTTGIGFADITGGICWVYDSDINNTGGTSSAGTFSAGAIKFYNTQIAVPINPAGGVIFAFRSIFDTSTQNISCITTSVSGTNTLQNCILNSGTASALSIGASTTVNATILGINSSNTNAITGAGTLNSGNIAHKAPV